ncbi:response regulator transcription factor [Nonomuraea dietziae]|uniref:DNA-binding CsgD family transcriptional regulator n=1 Tax=Nonomuraea dietziae TaxID=65515 RepID=A0A7W5Y8T9_9ACTN|nr:response regulator transcription factor [Nonomuraea dietziae]MBB3724958.1 DNA-binding CsgD family transcriptional regulator [Nonomuraea dietziae]
MRLTAPQERLYLDLLQGSYRSDPADETLHELQALGYVDEDLVAVPPPVAMDRLIRQRLEETSHELHRLNSLWGLLAHPQGGVAESMERIEGVDAVNRRIQAFRARSTVQTLKTAPKRGRGTPEEISEFRARLARGLRSRTVIPAAALTAPEQLAYAHAQHALGDLHRIVEVSPRSMVILDGTVAFVRIDPDDYAAGAMMIRHPGIVATLGDHFEHIWARARDLGEPSLTPIEQRVLQALATYSKDELSARAVNVSVRKFRAHVADLMARLGAANRFQAALLARERGWI